MKIEYNFATETVEIDIADEWCEILIDLDRQEYNNNHTETRRHYHLGSCLYEGDSFVVEDAALNRLLDDDGTTEMLQKALMSLRPQQRELLRRIYENGEKAADIARQEGVSKSAITNRLQKIYAVLQKKISKGG